MKTIRKTETEWVTSTVPPFLVIVGAGTLVLGAAVAFFAFRHPEIGKPLELAGVTAVMVVGGLYMLTYRRTLTLDRAQRRVIVVARYFGVPFVAEQPAVGAIGVKRWTQRSKELGTTRMYDVVLDGQLLVRLSDNQADESDADALARQFAEYLGLDHVPPRDRAGERERDARAAKYALVPLIAVVGVSFVAAVVYLLTS